LTDGIAIAHEVGIHLYHRLALQGDDEARNKDKLEVLSTDQSGPDAGRGGGEEAIEVGRANNGDFVINGAGVDDVVAPDGHGAASGVGYHDPQWEVQRVLIIVMSVGGALLVRAGFLVLHELELANEVRSIGGGGGGGVELEVLGQHGVWHN